jgi:hypothetical protein
MRYLPSLLNYFIKFNILSNQTIIEIDTYIKLIGKNRRKNYARLHILEILSENKYFLF